MALEEAAKEGIQLMGLIRNLRFPQDKAIIFYDSLSVICLAKDQVLYERTNHIEVRYHFICIEKRIELQKLNTRENPTDMFTKHIPKSKFMQCLDLLNVDCWK